MTLEQATERRLSDFLAEYDSGITELTGKAKREYGTEGEFVGRYKGLKPSYPEFRHIYEGPKAIAESIRRKSGPLFERVEAAVRDEMVLEGYRPAKKRSQGRPTVPPHDGRSYCKRCSDFHTKGQHRFHGPGSFNNTHLWGFSMKNPPTVAQAREVFAVLIQKSRSRSLTAAERKTLATASQIIRHGKRRTAAHNPKGRPSKRAIALTKAKVAGYEDDKRTFTRLVVESRVNRTALNEAWKQGVLMRESGATGSCSNPPAGREIYGQVIEIVCRRTGPHRCGPKCRAVNHTYRHVFKTKPPIYGVGKKGSRYLVIKSED